MSDFDIGRALVRISHEILERNAGAKNLVLLGIPTGGAHLCKRIAKLISEIEGSPVLAGTLDVTLHRDDLRLRAPKACPTIADAAVDSPQAGRKDSDSMVLAIWLAAMTIVPRLATMPVKVMKPTR